QNKKNAFSNFLRNGGFTVDVVLYKKVNQGADNYSYSCNQVIDVKPVEKTHMLAFNKNNTAKTRLHLYQGIQRAHEEMVNILVNGGRKYNNHIRKKTKQIKRGAKERETTIQEKGFWHPKKFEYNPTKLPVVAYGTEMKGKNTVKFKGHCVGLTRILYQPLKKRQRGGDLLLVDIDEFFTSRVSMIDFSLSMKGYSNSYSVFFYFCSQDLSHL
ncbi:hypothetical protein BDF14DRAFT_1730339, partial [Spinellus fusiger]